MEDRKWSVWIPESLLSVLILMIDDRIQKGAITLKEAEQLIELYKELKRNQQTSAVLREQGKHRGE